jgi:hypothetical protein
LSISLTNLRAQVRERADMTGSTFVADSANSLDAFINAACGELYDLLVAKFEDYFTTSGTLTLVAGTDNYPLSDINASTDKVLGVDVLDGSRYRDLKPFDFAHRNEFSGQSANPLTRMRYQLRGARIYFHPGPGVSGTARVWYVPKMTLLVSGSDTFDPYKDTWIDYVIASAAIRCLSKEESDVSALHADMARVKRQIDEVAGTRVLDGPARVVDTDGASMPEAMDIMWPRLGG